MKIMTGKTGAPHVTSQQFRQLVEGTVGQDSYILTSGENLEPELQTNNLLKIRSGMMSHHGNLSVVELGTYDEVTIQNGTQGMKRIDLVVNRYTRNEETGVEENNWVVIQGTPAAESPSAPAYTNGNLQDGDLVDDCPVFRVHLDGINVTEIEKLLDVVGNISDLNGNKIDKYNINVSNEVLTGETLASKPIYMRLVDIGVLPNNTTKTINTGITNAYYFWIDPTYSMVTSSGASYPLPYVDPTNIANSITARLIARGQQVVITTRANWSTYAGFVAVKYTKQ